MNQRQSENEKRAVIARLFRALAVWHSSRIASEQPVSLAEARLANVVNEAIEKGVIQP